MDHLYDRYAGNIVVAVVDNSTGLDGVGGVGGEISSRKSLKGGYLIIPAYEQYDDDYFSVFAHELEEPEPSPGGANKAISR